MKVHTVGYRRNNQAIDWQDDTYRIIFTNGSTLSTSGIECAVASVVRDV